MFIPRMWFDEVERVGKQRCTPVGYVLQQLGELIGFCGLVGLLGTPVFVWFLHWSLLSLLIVSVSLGIVGTVIVSFSWSLASRKGFHYDYQRRETSWVEAGEKRLYTFEDWKATTADRNR